MHFFRTLSALMIAGAIFVSSVMPTLARTPNDPYFGNQWYLRLIGAPEAWDSTIGNPQIIVAVLDTGVDLDHPDLADNLWENVREISGNGKDDDGNGYIDDVSGWDFVGHDADPSPDGGGENPDASPLALSHGTLIAGVIGAQTNNSIGYAGVNWQVRVMPIRILNQEGGGSEESAIAGLRYAVKNGARVVNLSFVGDVASTALRQAVEDAYKAGVVIVAALGNDGKNVNLGPVYPACFRSPDADWVIGVTATDETDAETEFTNFGSDCADLSAPGADIQGLTLSEGSDGLLGEQLSWDGTSAASPMVAGAAALILSLHPSFTPDQVRNALKLSVDPLLTTISGSGSLGVGRLNVAKALAVAASMDTATVPPAPSTEPTKQPPSESAAESSSHYSFVALGAPVGTEPWVKVYRADGTPYAEFLAFGSSFKGGVKVSMSDLNGDGTPEIMATPGAGGGPQIRIFNAAGALVRSFFAYDDTSRKGVSAAFGDVDGDFSDDIVAVTAGSVSLDAVVFGQDGKEKFRFPVSGYAPETLLNLTVADVDDDYDKEIVFAPQSGTPRLAVYDNTGKPLVDFLAYAENMTAGVSLASGDFDGDSRDEIVAAPYAPGSPHIRIFNKIGALWGQFFAGSETERQGAVLAVTDIDIDGKLDVVTAPQNGAGNVKLYTPRGSFGGFIGQNLIGTGGTSLSAW